MGNTEKNTSLCQIDAGIKTYSELEHIQMHPEMYIGQLGNGEKQGDGIYALLRKIIDNSVKEFQIGHGREIEVTVTSDDEVTVRDYGKGIPFEDLVRFASPVNVCPGCIMASGSKWTPPPASMKIVNAFSRHFTVISRRGGMSMTVTYENGELKNTQKDMVADADGTEVSFVPSIRTFPGFHYRLKHLRHWMQHYARLHPGLILVLTSVEVFLPHAILKAVRGNQNHCGSCRPPFRRSGSARSRGQRAQEKTDKKRDRCYINHSAWSCLG